MDDKVWMITGAGRGLGAAIASAALVAGDRVVATGHDPARVEVALGGASPRLLAVRLDVTEEEEAVRAVAAAVKRFGRIDVLVNSAGYALLGAVEECSAAEIEDEFRANVLGLLAVTRAVLPVMRTQRGGHVINMSSKFGYQGAAGAAAYCASVFAVEAITESLAEEAAPLGIRATAVGAGHFRTDFLAEDSARQAAERIADYDATAGVTRAEALTHGGWEAGDPIKLAQAILTIVRADTPPLRLPAGRDAVETLERKIASMKRELDRWRAVSVSMELDPADEPVPASA